MQRPTTAAIPGIVLAAGRSARMGRPKALLPIGLGQTFSMRIVETLIGGGVQRVVLVVRPGDDPVAAALGQHPSASLQLVPNPEPERGQLSSLQCGLAAIGAQAPAALVTLVDVPLVSVDTVRQLLHAWHEAGAPLVRPERLGRHGHPIVVSREVIRDLSRASTERSMRDVLARFLPRAVAVPSNDPGAFEDVDTPAEYERLLERVRSER